MHEIPPLAEQLLRSQGVSDAELDELRRTGTLRRGDGTGQSIDIQVGDSSPSTAQVSSITIDGIELSGATIPPQALAQLKRFHRFMPDNVIQNLELATGEDIDGDGQIGGGGTTPPPPPTHGITRIGETSARAEPTPPPSGAMPSRSGGDPFVGATRGSRVLPILLTLLVLGGLAYAAYRSFA